LGRLSPGAATYVDVRANDKGAATIHAGKRFDRGREGRGERGKKGRGKEGSGGRNQDGRRRVRPDCASRARGRLRHPEAEASDWSQ
jgi:hypothetical protein